MARKRVAGLKFRTKLEDGTYTTQNAGVALSTDWEGNYSLIVEIDTDDKTEEGYPVRAKLAAGKFVTPDGTVIKLDLTNTFINLIAWEDMDKRPERG
jgi:hypothetical protein